MHWHTGGGDGKPEGGWNHSPGTGEGLSPLSRVGFLLRSTIGGREATGPIAAEQRRDVRR